MNCVCIEGIEADDRAYRINHHKETNIVRLSELVGRFLEVVVDLFNAARKCRSIMSLWIERLDNVSSAL